MMTTLLISLAGKLLPAAYSRFAPALGKAFMYAILAAIIGAAYWHYTGLIDDKAALSRTIGQLETDLVTERGNVDTLKASRKQWVNAAAKHQAQADATKRTEAQARAELERLNDIFAKHDLHRLALRKPGLITKRVNAGTDRVFLAIECASGRVKSCRDQQPATQAAASQTGSDQNGPGSLASDNP